MKLDEIFCEGKIIRMVDLVGKKLRLGLFKRD